MDVRPSGDAAELGFMVELDRFHGPLDLLLHLIREQDIDIFDIPIAQITRQFLHGIEGVERLGLDRAGEFLEMAATLIRIKLQMLLPRRGEDADELEDPRAELVRRLLEYEHFREAARRLEEAESDRRRHFARGFLPPRPSALAAAPPPGFAWEELWAAVLALGGRAYPLTDHHVASRAVPLEEKVDLILQTLARRARVEFRHLIAPFGDRMHAVMTLLAALELARRRQCALRQREVFAPLWVYRAMGRAGDGDRPHH
ncbi:MAG: segregation/condensation protein A [Gemmatimonadetes bacterium]|nr:segregation/condensation protein A [Gemmatimonadota bacterium]